MLRSTESKKCGLAEQEFARSVTEAERNDHGIILIWGFRCFMSIFRFFFPVRGISNAKNYRERAYFDHFNFCGVSAFQEGEGCKYIFLEKILLLVGGGLFTRLFISCLRGASPFPLSSYFSLSLRAFCFTKLPRESNRSIDAID